MSTTAPCRAAVVDGALAAVDAVVDGDAVVIAVSAPVVGVSLTTAAGPGPVSPDCTVEVCWGRPNERASTAMATARVPAAAAWRRRRWRVVRWLTSGRSPVVWSGRSWYRRPSGRRRVWRVLLIGRPPAGARRPGWCAPGAGGS